MSDRRLRLHRYHEIGKVLVRHGFEGLVSEVGIEDAFGYVQRRRGRAEPPTETRPARLRRTLEDLGTTFVKLGQVLSTRPDIVPPEYIFELSKLQDAVPAVAYPQICETITEAFGKPPDEVFLEFDPVPRAAASIGQVHNARLLDGTSVVVKVRRQGIEKQVEEDLAIMADLARLVSQRSRLGKLYDVEGWVEEFAITLRNELDYNREGRNADRIRENFSRDPSVKVPVVYWDYTNSTVLTMEEICGIKISDLYALDEAGMDRKKLADRCAHIAVTQILDHGFFHADPHPGNFFVLENGVVGLIDYGMVGHMDAPLRNMLVKLALSAMKQDADRFIDEMLSMGMASRKVERVALRRDLRNISHKYDGKSLGEISVGKIFNEVMAVALRHGLRAPTDLMLVFRVIAMDEGMGAHLDPDFRLIEFAKPYLLKFYARSYSPAAVNRRLRENALDIGDVLVELPQKIRHLLGELERGEITYTNKIELPDSAIRAFQQAVNRIAISVLASGMIVGLSFLTLAHLSNDHTNLLNFVLEALLVIAIGSGAWLMASIWRSGR